MQLAEWLNSLPGVSDASPVSLTMGKESWQGAVYTQRGERRYYLLGKLPLCYGRYPKTCFQFDGDNRDWYVAGYMQSFANLTEAQREYHPFGNHWLMLAWIAPGKIDDHGPLYRRQRVAA